MPGILRIRPVREKKSPAMTYVTAGLGISVEPEIGIEPTTY